MLLSRLAWVGGGHHWFVDRCTQTPLAIGLTETLGLFLKFYTGLGSKKEKNNQHLQYSAAGRLSKTVGSSTASVRSVLTYIR